MVLILKSMPMVVMKEGVNESSLKRRRQHDFPTPESPIRRSLICGCLVSMCTDVAFVTAGRCSVLDEGARAGAAEDSQGSHSFLSQPCLRCCVKGCVYAYVFAIEGVDCGGATACERRCPVLVALVKCAGAAVRAGRDIGGGECTRQRAKVGWWLWLRVTAVQWCAGTDVEGQVERRSLGQAAAELQ